MHAWLLTLRVFTFGIGSGASTELIRGLAKAGNGKAEFIHDGERMQPKVITLLSVDTYMYMCVCV